MRRLFSVCLLLLSIPLAAAATPAEMHLPIDLQACSSAAPCKVAILSPGYGLTGSDYAFITDNLNHKGYLVVALRDSAGGVRLDPALPVAPQVQAMARITARSIAAIIDHAAPQYPQFDWQHLLLVGHSLGGDSSAQFAAENAGRVTSLISLDSRRLALPRTPAIRVLTLRASDTTADPGVLPDAAERARYRSCIVRIEGARHNDMQDAGSAQLKRRIISAIDVFLAPASVPTYACDTDSALD